MKLNKEQIAFIVAMLFLGWLSWSQLSADEGAGPRRPRRSTRGGGETIEISELDALQASVLDPSQSGWSATGRNVYRAPAEKSPLPPLSLQAPPRGGLIASPPQPVPGLDLHHRLDQVETIVPNLDVELPARTEDEGAGGDDLGGDFGDELAAGDETGAGGTQPGGVFFSNDESETLSDVSGEVSTSEEPGQGLQDEREKRREKKILGLRERLAQDAQARLEKERARLEKLQAIEERQRTLDKVFWQGGEVWYGEIMNDEAIEKGQPGFDRYEIKIRIDKLRADTSLSMTALETALKDRELEIEFRRWSEKGFSSKQKYSPTNIQKLEFAESSTKGAFTVDEFEVARRLAPLTDVKRHLSLIDRLGEISEWSLAKEHALRLLDAGHEELAVYRALALSARRDFDYNAEMRAVNEGLTKFAADSRLTAHLGELYSRLGLDLLAERSFEKALASEPRSSLANAGLGRHLLSLPGGGRERNVAALQYLEKASSGRFEDDERKREVFCDLGAAELAQGRLAAARRAFTRVVTEVPNHEEALLGLSAVAVTEGKTAEARDHVKSILEINSGSGRAYYTLGFAALAEERYVEARDLFHDAMRADPLLTARCHGALGYLYERLGKTADAQAAYAEAYVADPEDPEVLLRQGRGFLLVGDDQQAYDFLTRALAELPAQFDVLVSLSEACFNLGMLPESLRYLDAAMDLRPESPTLLLRKAQTLARMRRFDDAKTCLDRSKQLKDSDEVEVSLAYYYYIAGNHEEALKRFRTVERSLDRNNDSELANYVRDYSVAIADNLAKSVWTDHFNRVATGRDLLRDWRASAPGSGINISLNSNRVQMNGTQKQSDVPSAIVQRRSGREFVSFEASLSSKIDDQVTCGVGIFTFRKNTGDQNPYVDQDSGGIAYDAVIFGKTREGRLAYRLVTRYEVSRWESIGDSWPVTEGGEAASLSLGIEVADASKGTFNLLVNGAPVLADLEVKGLRRAAKDLQLWAFCQAEIDKRVDVKIDDVRIVTRDD